MLTLFDFKCFTKINVRLLNLLLKTIFIRPEGKCLASGISTEWNNAVSELFFKHFDK